MKKLALILSIFHLLVSSGVALTIHSCSGWVTDVGVFTASSSCCCADIETDCCKDEVAEVKFSEQVYQPVHLPKVDELIPTDLPEYLAERVSSRSESKNSSIARDMSLHNPLLERRYLRFQQLLVYG